MASAQRSITIARPVEQVFAFVADGENGSRWRSGQIDIKRIAGEGVGTRYAQRVPGPMGRRVSADYEITVFEPNRRLEFQTVAGPVRPHGRYDFEPVEDGTVLTFALDAQLTGIRKLLMGRMVQGSMEAEVAALDRLKRVLEA
jgi:uncharacterized protein YndB with AHSA1/START domain